MVSAALFRGKLAQGALNRAQIEAYRDSLPKIREIARRYRGRPGEAGNLGGIASWIMSNWPEQEQRYLADHLR